MSFRDPTDDTCAVARHAEHVECRGGSVCARGVQRASNNLNSGGTRRPVDGVLVCGDHTCGRYNPAWALVGGRVAFRKYGMTMILQPGE